MDDKRLLGRLEKASMFALDDYFELREMLLAGGSLESHEVKAQRLLVKEGFKPLSMYGRLRATMANEESNRLAAQRMLMLSGPAGEPDASGAVMSESPQALESGESTTSAKKDKSGTAA